MVDHAQGADHLAALRLVQQHRMLALDVEVGVDAAGHRQAERRRCLEVGKMPLMDRIEPARHQGGLPVKRGSCFVTQKHFQPHLAQSPHR